MAVRARKYLLLAVGMLVSWVAYANDNESKIDTLIAMDRVQITAIKHSLESSISVYRY